MGGTAPTLEAFERTAAEIKRIWDEGGYEATSGSVDEMIARSSFVLSQQHLRENDRLLQEQKVLPDVLAFAEIHTATHLRKYGLHPEIEDGAVVYLDNELMLDELAALMKLYVSRSAEEQAKRVIYEPGKEPVTRGSLTLWAIDTGLDPSIYPTQRDLDSLPYEKEFRGSKIDGERVKALFREDLIEQMKLRHVPDETLITVLSDILASRAQKELPPSWLAKITRGDALIPTRFGAYSQQDKAYRDESFSREWLTRDLQALTGRSAPMASGARLAGKGESPVTRHNVTRSPGHRSPDTSKNLRTPNTELRTNSGARLAGEGESPGQTSKVTDDDPRTLRYFDELTRKEFWKELNGDEKSFLNDRIERVRREEPEFSRYFLSLFSVLKMRVSPRGAYDLMRVLHPYTILAFKDRDNKSHVRASHESVYYGLFLKKMLGKLPKAGELIINVDPHSDAYYRLPNNEPNLDLLTGELRTIGIEDGNWAAVAVKDGLASVVISISPNRQSTRTRRGTDKRVYYERLDKNYWQTQLKYWIDQNQSDFLLTVDLDVFSESEYSSRSGERSDVHHRTAEVASRFMRWFSYYLKKNGFLPKELWTAISKGYLASPADDGWINSVIHSVEVSLASVLDRDKLSSEVTVGTRLAGEGESQVTGLQGQTEPVTSDSSPVASKNLRAPSSGLRAGSGARVSEIPVSHSVLKVYADFAGKDAGVGLIENGVFKPSHWTEVSKGVTNHIYDKVAGHEDTAVRSLLPIFNATARSLGVHWEDKSWRESGTLYEVMHELTKNAIRGIQRSRADGFIDVTAEIVDDLFVIKFKDQGIGLNDVDRSKLFSRYYTTKPKGFLARLGLMKKEKETGLGLFLSRRWVQDIVGGTLEAFDNQTNLKEDRSGSTFVITIPLSASERLKGARLSEATDLAKKIDLIFIADPSQVTPLNRMGGTAPTLEAFERTAAEIKRIWDEGGYEATSGSVDEMIARSSFVLSQQHLRENDRLLQEQKVLPDVLAFAEIHTATHLRKYGLHPEIEDGAVVYLDNELMLDELAALMKLYVSRSAEEQAKRVIYEPGKEPVTRGSLTLWAIDTGLDPSIYPTQRDLDSLPYEKEFRGSKIDGERVKALFREDLIEQMKLRHVPDETLITVLSDILASRAQKELPPSWLAKITRGDALIPTRFGAYSQQDKAYRDESFSREWLTRDLQALTGRSAPMASGARLAVNAERRRVTGSQGHTTLVTGHQSPDTRNNLRTPISELRTNSGARLSDAGPDPMDFRRRLTLPLDSERAVKERKRFVAKALKDLPKTSRVNVSEKAGRRIFHKALPFGIEMIALPTGMPFIDGLVHQYMIEPWLQGVYQRAWMASRHNGLSQEAVTRAMSRVKEEIDQASQVGDALVVLRRHLFQQGSYVLAFARIEEFAQLDVSSPLRVQYVRDVAEFLYQTKKITRGKIEGGRYDLDIILLDFLIDRVRVNASKETDPEVVIAAVRGLARLSGYLDGGAQKAILRHMRDRLREGREAESVRAEIAQAFRFYPDKPEEKELAEFKNFIRNETSPIVQARFVDTIAFWLESYGHAINRGNVREDVADLLDLLITMSSAVSSSDNIPSEDTQRLGLNSIDALGAMPYDDQETVERLKPERILSHLWTMITDDSDLPVRTHAFMAWVNIYVSFPHFSSQLPVSFLDGLKILSEIQGPAADPRIKDASKKLYLHFKSEGARLAEEEVTFERDGAFFREPIMPGETRPQGAQLYMAYTPLLDHPDLHPGDVVKIKLRSEGSQGVPDAGVYTVGISPARTEPAVFPNNSFVSAVLSLLNSNRDGDEESSHEEQNVTLSEENELEVPIPVSIRRADALSVSYRFPLASPTKWRVDSIRIVRASANSVTTGARLAERRDMVDRVIDEMRSSHRFITGRLERSSSNATLIATLEAEHRKSMALLYSIGYLSDEELAQIEDEKFMEAWTDLNEYDAELRKIMASEIVRRLDRPLIVERLIRSAQKISQNDAASSSLLSKRLLLHSAHPDALAYFQANPQSALPIHQLEEVTIRDKEGKSYTLRVIESDFAEDDVWVSIDSVEPAPLEMKDYHDTYDEPWDEAWSRGMNESGIKYADILRNKRGWRFKRADAMVGYIKFNVKNDGVVLDAMEMRSDFLDKGLGRALIQEIDRVSPIGLVISIPKIIEYRTVKDLKAGKSFEQTVWGSLFKGTGFVLTQIGQASSGYQNFASAVLIKKGDEPVKSNDLLGARLAQFDEDADRLARLLLETASKLRLLWKDGVDSDLSQMTEATRIAHAAYWKFADTYKRGFVEETEEHRKLLLFRHFYSNGMMPVRYALENYAPESAEFSERLVELTRMMDKLVEELPLTASSLEAPILSDTLNALDASALKARLHEAYRSRKLVRVSQYDDWRALGTSNKPIAGVLVLRKIEGEWRILLGRRSAGAKNNQGVFSGPVGGVQAEETALTPGEVSDLTERGILTDKNVDPAIVMAAMRELGEETGIQISAQDIDARLDDFRGDDETRLVNFMVHVDTNETPSVQETKELAEYEWVPIRVLLDTPEDLAGAKTEEWLKDRVPNSRLMHGLKQSGMNNLRKILIAVSGAGARLSKGAEEFEAAIDEVRGRLDKVPLKDGDRKVIELYEKHNGSIKDVAYNFESGVSRERIRQRMKRAVRDIRRFLEDEKWSVDFGVFRGMRMRGFLSWGDKTVEHFEAVGIRTMGDLIDRTSEDIYNILIINNEDPWWAAFLLERLSKRLHKFQPKSSAARFFDRSGARLAGEGESLGQKLPTTSKIAFREGLSFSSEFSYKMANNSIYRDIFKKIESDFFNSPGNPILIIDGISSSGKTEFTNALQMYLREKGRKTFIVRRDWFSRILVQRSGWMEARIQLEKIIEMFLLHVLRLSPRWVSRRYNRYFLLLDKVAIVERQLTALADAKEQVTFQIPGGPRVNEQNIIIEPGTVILIEGALTTNLFSSVKAKYILLQRTHWYLDYLRRAIESYGQPLWLSLLRMLVLENRMFGRLLKTQLDYFDMVLDVSARERPTIIKGATPQEAHAGARLALNDPDLSISDRVYAEVMGWIIANTDASVGFSPSSLLSRRDFSAFIGNRSSERYQLFTGLGRKSAMDAILRLAKAIGDLREAGRQDLYQATDSALGKFAGARLAERGTPQGDLIMDPAMELVRSEAVRHKKFNVASTFEQGFEEAVLFDPMGTEHRGLYMHQDSVQGIVDRFTPKATWQVFAERDRIVLWDEDQGDVFNLNPVDASSVRQFAEFLNNAMGFYGARLSGWETVKAAWLRVWRRLLAGSLEEPSVPDDTKGQILANEFYQIPGLNQPPQATMYLNQVPTHLKFSQADTIQALITYPKLSSGTDAYEADRLMRMYQERLFEVEELFDMALDKASEGSQILRAREALRPRLDDFWNEVFDFDAVLKERAHQEALEKTIARLESRLGELDSLKRDLKAMSGARLSSTEKRASLLLEKLFHSARLYLNQPGRMHLGVAIVTGVSLLFAFISGYRDFYFRNNTTVAAILLTAASPFFSYRTFTAYASFFWGHVLKEPPDTPRPYQITDPDLPTVTVQIAVRNEPFEVARMTLDSALALKYPPDKLQIQVIDNSDSEDQYKRFQDYAIENGAVFIHRDGTQGYKARNLNLGASSATGDFFLILDADSTVGSDVLLRALPEFQDEKLGYAQLRVSTSNGSLNALTHVLQEGAARDHLLLHSRNRQGFVSFDGHNGIVRRSALEKVGLWEELVTEDLATAVNMWLAGYRGKYLLYTESGEWAPTSFPELKKQRNKWSAGTAEVFFKKLPNILRSSKLTLFEKIDIYHRMSHQLMSVVAYILAFFYIQYPLHVSATILALSYGPVFGSYLISEERQPIIFYLKGLLVYFIITPPSLLAILRYISGSQLSFKVTDKSDASVSKLWGSLRDNFFSLSISSLYFAGSLLLHWDDYGAFLVGSLPSNVTMLLTFISPFLIPALERKKETEVSNLLTYKRTVYRQDGGVEHVEWPADVLVYQSLDDFLVPEEQKTIRSDIAQRRDDLNVSVVIPTFNSAGYLTDTLDHILEQMKIMSKRHPRWKLDLIVSVNGSGAVDALRVAQEFQKRVMGDSIEVSIIYLEGIQNKPHAMNAGAIYAKKRRSDLIAFIDDDVRYEDDSMSRVFEYLIDHPNIFLTGPLGSPIRVRSSSVRLFDRVENFATSDAALPLTQGMFMPTLAYPLVSQNIIADDSYLNVYVMPRDAGESRIALVPETSAHWKLTGSPVAYLKRYARASMAIKQLRSIFLTGDRFDRLMGVFRSKPMHERASPRQLLQGLTSIKKVEMAALVTSLYMARVFIGSWNDIKIKTRSTLGLYPFATEWYEVTSTKPLAAGHDTEGDVDKPRSLDGARLSSMQVRLMPSVQMGLKLEQKIELQALLKLALTQELTLEQKQELKKFLELALGTQLTSQAVDGLLDAVTMEDGAYRVTEEALRDGQLPLTAGVLVQVLNDPTVALRTSSEGPQLKLELKLILKRIADEGAEGAKRKWHGGKKSPVEQKEAIDVFFAQGADGVMGLLEMANDPDVDIRSRRDAIKKVGSLGRKKFIREMASEKDSQIIPLLRNAHYDSDEKLSYLAGNVLRVFGVRGARLSSLSKDMVSVFSDVPSAQFDSLVLNEVISALKKLPKDEAVKDHLADEGLSDRDLVNELTAIFRRTSRWKASFKHLAIISSAIAVAASGILPSLILPLPIILIMIQGQSIQNIWTHKAQSFNSRKTVEVYETYEGEPMGARGIIRHELLHVFKNLGLIPSDFAASVFEVMAIAEQVPSDPESLLGAVVNKAQRLPMARKDVGKWISAGYDAMDKVIKGEADVSLLMEIAPHYRGDQEIYSESYGIGGMWLRLLAEEYRRPAISGMHDNFLIGLIRGKRFDELLPQALFSGAEDRPALRRAGARLSKTGVGLAPAEYISRAQLVNDIRAAGDRGIQVLAASDLRKTLAPLNSGDGYKAYPGVVDAMKVILRKQRFIIVSSDPLDSLDRFLEANGFIRQAEDGSWTAAIPETQNLVWIARSAMDMSYFEGGRFVHRVLSDGIKKDDVEKLRQILQDTTLERRFTEIYSEAAGYQQESAKYKPGYIQERAGQSGEGLSFAYLPAGRLIGEAKKRFAETQKPMLEELTASLNQKFADAGLDYVHAALWGDTTIDIFAYDDHKGTALETVRKIIFKNGPVEFVMIGDKLHTGGTDIMSLLTAVWGIQVGKEKDPDVQVPKGHKIVFSERSSDQGGTAEYLNLLADVLLSDKEVLKKQLKLELHRIQFQEDSLDQRIAGANGIVSPAYEKEGQEIQEARARVEARLKELELEGEVSTSPMGDRNPYEDRKIDQSLRAIETDTREAIARGLVEENFRLRMENARLKRENAQLKESAHTDPLTGVRNRAFFSEYLPNILDLATSNDFPVSMIALDLDNFKDVNDTNGHAVGDEVLKYAGRVLKSSLLRPHDFMLEVANEPSRIGGEEFFIVLPGTDIDGAAAVANRIREAFEKRVDWTKDGEKTVRSFTFQRPGQEDGEITASLGVAQFRLGENAADFANRADEALYKAKQAGRNRVERETPVGARLAIRPYNKMDGQRTAADMIRGLNPDLPQKLISHPKPSRSTNMAPPERYSGFMTHLSRISQARPMDKLMRVMIVGPGSAKEESFAMQETIEALQRPTEYTVIDYDEKVLNSALHPQWTKILNGTDLASSSTIDFVRSFAEDIEDYGVGLFSIIIATNSLVYPLKKHHNEMGFNLNLIARFIRALEPGGKFVLGKWDFMLLLPESAERIRFDSAWTAWDQVTVRKGFDLVKTEMERAGIPGAMDLIFEPLFTDDGLVEITVPENPEGARLAQVAAPQEIQLASDTQLRLRESRAKTRTVFDYDLWVQGAAVSALSPGSPNLSFHLSGDQLVVQQTDLGQDQNNGIGQKITEWLRSFAVDNGFKEVVSQTRNPAVLYIRQKLFGLNNVDVFDVKKRVWTDATVLSHLGPFRIAADSEPDHWVFNAQNGSYINDIGFAVTVTNGKVTASTHPQLPVGTSEQDLRLDGGKVFLNDSLIGRIRYFEHSLTLRARVEPSLAAGARLSLNAGLPDTNDRLDAQLGRIDIPKNVQRIYIAEDDDDMRMLLKHMIGLFIGNGIEVREFANAEDLLRAHSQDPAQVIFTDNDMGATLMRGVQLIAELRSQSDQDLLTVLTTAGLANKIAREADSNNIQLLNGKTVILFKPYEFDDIQKIANKISGARLAESEAADQRLPTADNTANPSPVSSLQSPVSSEGQISLFLNGARLVSARSNSIDDGSLRLLASGMRRLKGTVMTGVFYMAVAGGIAPVAVAGPSSLSVGGQMVDVSGYASSVLSPENTTGQDRDILSELEDGDHSINEKQVARIAGSMDLTQINSQKTVEMRLITDAALSDSEKSVYHEMASEAEKLLRGGKIILRFGTMSNPGFSALPGSELKDSYAVVYVGRLSKPLLQVATGQGIAPTEKSAAEKTHLSLSQIIVTAVVQRSPGTITDPLLRLWAAVRANPTSLLDASSLGRLQNVAEGADLSTYEHLTMRAVRVSWERLVSTFKNLRSITSAA